MNSRREKHRDSHYSMEELSDGEDIQDVFTRMTDYELEHNFLTPPQTPVSQTTINFELAELRPSSDPKKENMDFDFETEVNQALKDQDLKASILFSSSSEEVSGEDMEVVSISAFGPSSSSASSGSSSEDEEMKPISAPVFEPATKETEGDLRDPECILERVIEARIQAEDMIAKKLVEILHLDPEEDLEEVLAKYVGGTSDADSPLYNNGPFFILFVTSILLYACRIGLQRIHQKSDNQKISKSPHPLLQNTQRSDLWRQFWGSSMPDRGQSLNELQAKYTNDLPILRIWTYFKRQTSKHNEVAGKPIASQWCYPLLSSMMYSARFRYTLSRVPGPNEYYCALTGVPIRPGTEAFLCSFICEVSVSSEKREKEKGEKGGSGKGKGRGKEKEKAPDKSPEMQTVGCVIQKTLPSRGKGGKRVGAEPLIKLIRSVSEFDKTIANWVRTWVDKHGSKLPNMKRDTIAYALTSEEGLEEISQWYVTFHVLVATMRHAICG